MRIMITSWNCQGDFLGKISQSAVSILDPQDFNIVLIQEAGALEEVAGEIIDVQIAGNDYKAYFEEQEDADNKRCTTGILVDARLWGNEVTGLQNLSIGGVRRPLVFCTIYLGGALLYVSTIHATANHDIAKDEICKLCKYWKKTCRLINGSWIIMGDMNCDAGELDIDNVCMIVPDESTQKSGGTLDYAIMPFDLEPYVARWNGNSRIWVDEAYRNSDHLVVKICLDL